MAFSLPLLCRVPEPPAAGEPAAPVRDALAQLAATGQALRRHPQAARLMLAFLVYNDGIGTIIRMATVYGTEIGIGRGALIAAVLLVQFVGIPFAFLFGGLAGRIGAKRAVLGSLAVYALISVVGYFMRTAAHFFALALLVAVVQGGAAGAVALALRLAGPARRSGEFFGFFSVIEKVAGIFGPGLFTARGLADRLVARRHPLGHRLLRGGGLLLPGGRRGGQRAARAADAAGWRLDVARAGERRARPLWR